VTQPEHESPDEESSELLARRKREVWQIVLVMTLTSCIGSILLIFLLWWIFQKITP